MEMKQLRDWGEELRVVPEMMVCKRATDKLVKIGVVVVIM